MKRKIIKGKDIDKRIDPKWLKRGKPSSSTNVTSFNL